MKKLGRKKLNCLVSMLFLILLISGGIVFFREYKVKASSSTTSKVDSKKNEESIEKKLSNYRNKVLGLDNIKTIKNDSNKNNSSLEETTIILKDKSLSEVSGNSVFSKKLKNKEDKIINNQDSIVNKIEKITGKKVENQLGYIVNAVTIKTNSAQRKKIAKLKGVESVNVEKRYYKTMSNALEEGNVSKQLEDINYEYTGEGTVIAVIDTGVNYQHKDMSLNMGVNTKYTKNQWKEKIKLLGYGAYFTDKVPFGYDYVNEKNECLNKNETHGYHVAGIAASNGAIQGVASNAQVIGMKVFNNEGYCITRDIVKAIEDAVKLGVDIINISIGDDTASFVTEDNPLQEAIRNAYAKGVIVCVSAGNMGTSVSYGTNNNYIGLEDVSGLSSMAVVKEALTVASADNITKNNKEIVMSSFSSWGPTLELDIKPEIVAPGGNIFSLSSKDNYETLSGTSMSSPYIAGSEAIVLNSIKKKGIEIKGSELAQLMKNSLMNTADPITEKSTGNPYSVRYQGAGIVDVFGAVNNNVIATVNGEAKVLLGEYTTNKTVDITLKNYGTEDAKYTLKDELLYTDFIENGKTKELADNKYGIKVIDGAKVCFDTNEVIVPAKGEKNIKATFIMPKDMEINTYVEGFIHFKGNNIENIGLPVLGYYGDYGKELVIDNSIYNNDNSLLNNENNILDIKSYTCIENNVFKVPQRGSVGILGRNISYERYTEEDKQENEIERIDKSKAIKATFNKKLDLVLDKPNEQVLYKITAKEDIEYSIKIDKDICPLVKIFNKDGIEINNIVENSQWPLEDETLYIEKGESYYIEVCSLINTIGKYYIEFNKISNKKDINTYNYTLELNKELKIKCTKDNRWGFHVEFIPSKSSFYKFNFSIFDDNTITVYEQKRDKSLNATYMSIIRQITCHKKNALEIYCKKNTRYSFDVECTGRPLKLAKELASIRVNKSSGKNAYKENISFSSNKCAFSPNNDFAIDEICISLTQLRAAKEIKVNILNEKKEKIRCLVNATNCNNIASISRLWNNKLLIDGYNNFWDGTVYDSTSGEYNVVEDGQYYVQIVSKYSDESKEQLIEMPIKVDTKEPEVKIEEISNKKNYVKFSANDTSGLGEYVFLLYNIPSAVDNVSFETLASLKKDEKGNYILPLNNIKNQDVYLWVEDAAGNHIMECIQDVDDNVTDYKDEVDNLYNVSQDVDVDMEKTEQYVIYEDIVTDLDLDKTINKENILYENGKSYLQLNGTIKSENKLFINNVEAVIEEYNFDDYIEEENSNNQKIDEEQNEKYYSCKVPIEIKNNRIALDIKVKDVNGKEIYSKNSIVKVDLIAPRIEINKNRNIKKIEYFEENIYLLWDIDANDKLSFKIKVIDDNENNSTISNISFISGIFKYQKESDGVYVITKDDETKFTDNCEECTLYIQDAAGNKSNYSIGIYTKEKKYNEDILDDKTYYSISTDDIITKDMVDKNDNIIFEGSFNTVPDSCYINNKKINVNPQTYEFKEKIHVNKGYNRVNIVYSVSGIEYNIVQEMYYEDAKVNFENLDNKKENGIIYTDNQIFNIKGAIKSYFPTLFIMINGNLVYNNTLMDDDFNNNYLKKFDYRVKLKKGLNIIKFEYATIGNDLMEEELKVYF